MAENVRVTKETHAAAMQIARAKHLPITEVMARAVETYRRSLFLEQVAQDFAQLRENPKLWGEELGEREAWDATLTDGLGDD